MESILANFSESNWWLAYIAIFFGMIIEGEVILLISGFLVKSGKIDFFSVLFFAICGAILHDIVCWAIGNWLKKTSRKRFLFFDLGKKEKFLEKVRKHGGLYIFISKFTYGTNRLTLIASGYLGTAFKTLINYSAPASVIWATVVISLGYFFADKLNLLKKDIGFILLAVAGLLVVIFFFGRLLHKIFITNRNNKHLK